MGNAEDTVTPLEDGKFEVLVSRGFGTDEQIQVRCTITDPEQFEPMRQKLYANFITPRRLEHQQEVVEYQMEMARASAAVEAELNGKKG